MLQFGSYIAIFFVVWWLCFVAVLPIGARSQAEAGSVVEGTDPAAPVMPRMWMRIGIATALAVVCTGLLAWGLSNETLVRYWNH
jgi:predicted secreted protein